MRVGRAVFPVWREGVRGEGRSYAPITDEGQVPASREGHVAPSVLPPQSSSQAGRGRVVLMTRVSADEQANNPNLLPLISKLEPEKRQTGENLVDLGKLNVYSF